MDPDNVESNRNFVTWLNDLRIRCESCRKYLDIHLLISTNKKEFNLWRNIGRFYARTAWVLMLDVDLLPCTDFRERIRNNELYKSMLRTGRVGLVIPAFEYRDKKAMYTGDVFPRNKTVSLIPSPLSCRSSTPCVTYRPTIDPCRLLVIQALLELRKDKEIQQFYADWPPGHTPADYPKWYGAEDETPYRVAKYHYDFEPYMIYPRQGVPW
jgi:glycosyltransferase-like protein LARGE